MPYPFIPRHRSDRICFTGQITKTSHLQQQQYILLFNFRPSPTKAGRTSTFRHCSASVELSTYWDPLYFEHWTIQVASEDVSL